LTFGYDALYRLTSSPGRWTRPGNEHTYSLAMGYDDIHNISKKTQNHLRLSDEGDLIRQHKTTYDYTYTYTYAGPQPHAPTAITGRSFTYDLNGNQTGWVSDQGNTRRVITWDEENRIQAIRDNGQLLTYRYNDAGERVFKTGPQGETVYLNQFFSVSNREGGSKHVYVGASRMATKLVKGQENVVTPGNGIPPGHLKNGGGNGNGPSGNNGGGSGGGSPGNAMVIFEPDVFYYHPDHLGTTSYVTDLTGQVYQHLEYFPFGETWVEEVSNRWRVPYLFTAKELDRETGLYYFGARYYDPRTSVWQSVDPIVGDYLNGLVGGFYEPSTLNLYGYARNNPVILQDADGRIVPIILAVWAVAEIGLTAYDIYSTADTLLDKNASTAEKVASAGGLILGAIAPGGGYAPIGKSIAKEIAEEGFERAAREGGERVGREVAEGASKSVDPKSIRFSQNSVNGADDIAASMRANGWQGDAIDVVRMPDGKLTTLDNTRVLAADQAGINVSARIHNYSDPLPSNFVERFTTKRGGTPSTFGDAAQNRIGNQNKIYRETYPSGSHITGTR